MNGSEAVPSIERDKIRIRRACDKSIPLSDLPTLEQNEKLDLPTLEQKEKPMSYSEAAGNVSAFKPFRLNPNAAEFPNQANN